MSTSLVPADKIRDGAYDLQRIIEGNELFLLRTLSGSTSGKGKKNTTSALHATVICIKDSKTPSKATQISALGIEPNPFYVSILHPRTNGGLRSCCGSIGPAFSFRPDILRSSLRVFVPQTCKPAAWTKAVSWLWKTMEKNKGKTSTTGKCWVETGGLDFWESLERELVNSLHDQEESIADIRLGRMEVLAWVDDLLRRSRRPSPQRRHVLHATRVVDPGTLMPVFDGGSDEEYRLLCEVDRPTTEEERALVGCFHLLFNVDSILLHEALTEVDRRAWERLVELDIARWHDMNGRRFYFSPYRILLPSLEAMCRPRRTVIDIGPSQYRPVDLLARIMVRPANEYIMVYDSTITPDSPDHRVLLSHFERTPHDLATIEIASEDTKMSATLTRRIRQVASIVYRKKTDNAPLESQSIKTVILLDFAHWRLGQLVRLCACFSTNRLMSKSFAGWVAMNVTDRGLSTTPAEAVDPREWTRDTSLASVFAWFDMAFIDQ